MDPITRLRLAQAKFNSIMAGNVENYQYDSVQKDIEREIKKSESDSKDEQLITLEDRSKELYIEMKSKHERLSELTLSNLDNKDPNLIERRKELALSIISIEAERIRILNQIKYYKEYGRLPDESIKQGNTAHEVALSELTTDRIRTKLNSARSQKSRLKSREKKNPGSQTQALIEIEKTIEALVTEYNLRK